MIEGLIVAAVAAVLVGAWLLLVPRKEPARDVLVLDGECVDAAEDYIEVVNELLTFAGVPRLVESCTCVEIMGIRYLTVRTPRGTFRAELRGDTDWMDNDPLLDMLNELLAANGSSRQLHELSDGRDQCSRFVCVDAARADELRRAGRLTRKFTLAAEKVTALPIEPGTSVEHHASGHIRRATLARDTDIHGIPCAKGPIELGLFGHVERATLARDHEFDGLVCPRGSDAQFWADERLEEGVDPPQSAVLEVTIAAPTRLGRHVLPKGTALNFAEDGRFTFATLSEPVGKMAAGAMVRLDADGQLTEE